MDIEINTNVSNIGVEVEKAGPVGLSAYQVAVKNGFVGTEQEWLDSLVGEKGEKGDTGDTGDTGEPGRDGVIQYTAGDNITIENNVISATGGDLSNYYTKTQIDTRLDNVEIFTNLQADATSVTSPISYFQNVFDAMLDGKQAIIINNFGNNMGGASGALLFISEKPSNVSNDLANYSGYIYFKTPFFRAVRNLGAASPGNIGDVSCYKYIRIKVANGIVTERSNAVSEQYHNSYNVNSIPVLSTMNITAYTPTTDYHPATKKYVDDAIANIPSSSGGSIANFDVYTDKYLQLFNGDSIVNNLIYEQNFIDMLLSVTENGTNVGTILINSAMGNALIKCRSIGSSGDQTTFELAGYMNYVQGSANASYISYFYIQADIDVANASYYNSTVVFNQTNPIEYSGYDSSKTQVLKNVNGSIQWVDE